MSIEIDWEALTTGPEGAELAQSIRGFIHDKFQEIQLPRFIRSVEVHAFEFGDSCPNIVIKDICDPLPDFYEDGEDDDEDENNPAFDESRIPTVNHGRADHMSPARQLDTMATSPSFADDRATKGRPKTDVNFQATALHNDSHALHVPNTSRQVLPRLQSNVSLADQLASPLLSRSSTPGIPGGTSSLSYFHLPLAGRIQGMRAQSPLSAVAGWQEYQAEFNAHRLGAGLTPTSGHEGPSHGDLHRSNVSPTQANFSDPDPSTRPSTAHSHNVLPSQGINALSEYPSPRTPPVQVEPEPNDLQIVLHVSYNGNVRLSLTAEILLDYPMPSFVGIPLKLNITGLSFDGVALLALLNNSQTKRGATEGASDRRAHFCFLGQEDAETLVGSESILNDYEGRGPARLQGLQDTNDKLGSLLREMRVESEIGKTEDGRQNLKNVGKVEKFVLEQVRRIFEDEFVYPSFWTLLV